MPNPLQDLIDKLGVERRLVTAGRSKGMLDPFRPVREEEEAVLRATLEEVHGAFKVFRERTTLETGC